MFDDRGHRKLVDSVGEGMKPPFASCKDGEVIPLVYGIHSSGFAYITSIDCSYL